MISTRITLDTVSAGLASERPCSLVRSDVVCYDNMTRVLDPTKWTYNGGPNLNTTYTGATGYIGLLGAYCSRPDKMRFEWSYSQSAAIALAASLKPKLIGGNINGLVNNVTPLLAFGARTLYGVRYNHIGSGNSLADVTDPTERARLLGDDPAAATYSDNMRGISDWARASLSFKALHHDDPACMWASHTAGGSFRASTWVGFPGGSDYTNQLRALYANDAAYDTARPLGTVPSYFIARQWLLDQVTAWHVLAADRAHSHGMDYSLNITAPLPTKHPQMPYALVGSADYGMCELAWQTMWREGTSGRYVTDRAAAETLTDATTLRRMFATMALHAMVMRGAARKFTFAVWPLLDWIPAKSGGAGSAPSTAPYTIPYKVAAQQRIGWAWCQALGGPSIIPAGIYDEAAGDQAEWGYTGYTGDSKPFYYMAPATAKPWFDWVANNPDILDPFDACPTVAIVQPMGTAFWRGSSDGASNTAWVWMDSYVRPLVEANVPFVILPLDAAMGYPSHDTSKYMAVVTASADALTLPGSLSSYAPVTVAGSSDANRPVFCTTRIDRARQRLAIHVVNSHSCDYAASAGVGGVGTTQSAITLTLKPWAMLTRTIKAARWYSHEATTQGVPVRLRTDDKGAVLSLPAFLEAGVVVLDFA